MTRNQPPNLSPTQGTSPARPTESSPKTRRKSPNSPSRNSTTLATCINPSPLCPSETPTARRLQSASETSSETSVRVVVETNLHAAQRPAVVVREFEPRRQVLVRPFVPLLAQACL